MITREMLESLTEFDSPLLANTLDYIDVTPPHEFYMSGEIQSVTPGLGRTVGIAVTCKFDSSTPGNRPDADLFWRQLEQIDAMELPVVWVVEAVGTRPDHECILGDGTAKLLHSVGCVGTVTNGRARDVDGLRAVPFPAYCRGVVVHHCGLRIVAIDTPVSVGGITVRAGDVIHASEEGVIRVSSAAIPGLLQRAPDMRVAERAVHELWRRSDVSPAEKRRHIQQVYARYGFIIK